MAFCLLITLRYCNLWMRHPPKILLVCIFIRECVEFCNVNTAEMSIVGVKGAGEDEVLGHRSPVFLDVWRPLHSRPQDIHAFCDIS
jgi:hypothetical protein